MKAVSSQSTALHWAQKALTRSSHRPGYSQLNQASTQLSTKTELCGALHSQGNSTQMLLALV